MADGNSVMREWNSPAHCGVPSMEGGTTVGEALGWFLHDEKWVKRTTQQQKGEVLDWCAGSQRKALQWWCDGGAAAPW
jgi:hypothetical protein